MFTTKSQEANINPGNQKKLVFHKIQKSYLLPSLVLSLAVVIAVFIVFYQPITNSLILKNANPQMIALAQQAGMSKEGEILFLRTKPQFATDAEMSIDCANNAAANNKNGFIEQGCYIPDVHNNAQGRIYIRQMPASLYDQEIVTAAYEMLHSVYFRVYGSSQATNFVQTIESNYNLINNKNLNQQVVNFANTEPGYRDLELFSLLGTEFSKLSPNLQKYYSPYFSNRQLTVNNYQQINSTFNNERSQLSQLHNTIVSDDSLANKAYADSLAWAQQGNAYEDAYNYNIYKNYINQENTTINQYNQLSNDYNKLVAEFNGSQPIRSLQSVQVQNSK